MFAEITLLCSHGITFLTLIILTHVFRMLMIFIILYSLLFFKWVFPVAWLSLSSQAVSLPMRTDSLCVSKLLFCAAWYSLSSNEYLLIYLPNWNNWKKFPLISDKQWAMYNCIWIIIRPQLLSIDVHNIIHYEDWKNHLYILSKSSKGYTSWWWWRICWILSMLPALHNHQRTS